MFELQDITVSYADKQILNGISWSFSGSGIIGLIGLNGSGKSTLIKSIAGLKALDKGDILFNEQSLPKLSVIERSKLVSVVLTKASLPENMTVYELISLGRTPYLNWYTKLSDRDQHIIEKYMNVCAVKDFAHRKVKGLSDGERQRVFFCKALVQECGLMLLDEPTSFMDFVQKERLFTLLKHVVDELKLTIIISTHDMDAVLEYTDAILLLKSGKIQSFITSEMSKKELSNQLKA